jgi:DNA-binding beta-propeller fold protein YncE
MNSNTSTTSIISVINATMNMVVKTSSVVVGKPAGITIKPNTNTIYITNTLSKVFRKYRKHCYLFRSIAYTTEIT